ncbi:histone deacetylase family protein [Phorcysia thermohydrogeniphila]|uniref:Acetoin utilization deacetylase AcuC-like enzyme n=1 Tax=Phorcysia thermohydrogeniphila TaxID=936138 RepID=A0A4R1GEB7_9BACT|nr:histone deacetylase [Phorcysia thermohydrogeniphila]TCK06544.1 acetoin utilization deacetylase AcuC-like enzyme [Phorcysia thermohydrogeniphila]
MRTAVIYDDIFLKHDLPTHPENALRLKYFLKSLPEFNIPVLKPKNVSYDILRAVHFENYIEDVRISCRENAPGFFDPDTYYGEYTFDVALMAAGAVEMGVELLLSGKLRSVFCAVRPPGHHAEKGRAMGFCIFNNVAVGAVKALSLGAQRVFIVDFDAHHGNGTQHIFENTPEVFYFSTHQYPFYPGTGSTKENRSNVLNVPMKEGTGDAEFQKAYGETYRKAVKSFSPDIILVSAGYDLHRDDPLAGLEVTDSGIEYIITQILESAEELKIPVLFSLEGGYNLYALERCGRITFRKLAEFS